MLSTIGLTSCIDDEFTTNPNHLLSFERDSVPFDTVFTELTSPIIRFAVYNKNKKMLNISSIRVHGNESGAEFFLNVDGMKGKQFQNVEVRGNDSIFVFIQVKLDERHQNQPQIINDMIEFETNGVIQRVKLSAWGQDAIRIHGKEMSISSDTKFTADKPYIIFDTLRVEKGAILTIEPGATLCFHDKGTLEVEGCLNALGTQDQPINFRGDRIDKVIEGIPFDIMSAQWNGIHFTSESMYNEMQYVYMRGTTNGVKVDSCLVDDKNAVQLHLLNSVLSNSAGSILESYFGHIAAEGTQFSECALSALDMVGGVGRFINCTFGNQYLFAAPMQAIVQIEQPDEDLAKCYVTIDNSIIYGNTSSIFPLDFTGKNVFLRYCMLKESGTDDDNFIHCLWEGVPKLYVEREKYIFDYRLRDESPGIGAGMKDYCKESMRYDRYGNDRYNCASGGIDLGAYVYVPEPEPVEEVK